MQLYNKLIAVLKKENSFITDHGELKKWVVISAAQNGDERLIELLLADDELKRTFFKPVAGTMLFLQNKFLQFAEQKMYLEDSYTAYRNIVGLTIGGKFFKQRNEVELVWPYKDCILEGSQTREEQKRDEIFFNQTLAQDEITKLLDPKVLTNAKRYDAKGIGNNVDFQRNAEINIKRGTRKDTITDNLIIKGNNLLALNTLERQFSGQVKLIYIDPPYNTGNDSFGYNDNFNHSSWLTFMKNRLEVVKTLLRDDGCIFVQCDDNEQAYLKVLMDEVFGRNNFVNTISVRSSTPSGTKTAHKDKTIIKQKDLIHVFRKSKELSFNPQYTKRENWDSHYSIFLEKNKHGQFVLSKLLDKLKEQKLLSDGQKIDDIDINNKAIKEFYLKYANNICRLQSHKNKEADRISREHKDEVYEYYDNGESKGLFYNGQVITPLVQGIKKVYSNQKFIDDLGILACDFWEDIDFQNTQNEGGVSFPTAKKPEVLINRIINLVTNEGDIVLDYHLGSGTTAAVAHKMGRQYIGIEQLDYGEDDSVVRLRNVIKGEQSGISKSVNWQGGGSFVYLELKKYNQEFIERIEAAKDTKELLQIWDEMKEKSFLTYNIDLKKQDAEIEEFKALTLQQQKQTLCELLDKNQLYVNLSELDNKDFACTKEEKAVTRAFYDMED